MYGLTDGLKHFNQKIYFSESWKNIPNVIQNGVLPALTVTSTVAVLQICKQVHKDVDNLLFFNFFDHRKKNTHKKPISTVKSEIQHDIIPCSMWHTVQSQWPKGNVTARWLKNGFKSDFTLKMYLVLDNWVCCISQAKCGPFQRAKDPDPDLWVRRQDFLVT